MQETRVRYLSQEDPLEEGMTTHSSIPAWRIPWIISKRWVLQSISYFHLLKKAAFPESHGIYVQARVLSDAQILVPSSGCQVLPLKH